MEKLRKITLFTICDLIVKGHAFSNTVIYPRIQCSVQFFLFALNCIEKSKKLKT